MFERVTNTSSLNRAPLRSLFFTIFLCRCFLPHQSDSVTPIYNQPGNTIVVHTTKRRLGYTTVSLIAF
jgi:hypothetical protein